MQTETLYGGSTNGGPISDPTKLYVPHTENVSNCSGYWLASLYTGSDIRLFDIGYNGNVGNGVYNLDEIFGVRPVVCLPASITGIVGETVEIKQIKNIISY